MPRSYIASKMRTYLFVTLGAPIFMLVGIVAFIGCLVCLAMGLWDESVIHAMFYINGAITVFMVGCALIFYRSTMLTDIAWELHANGTQGTATILESEYNGRVAAERHKLWYALKLAVQPDDSDAPPFTVDIEQLFHEDVVRKLTVGNVVPVRFSPDSDIFTLVMLHKAYVQLK